MVPARKVQNLEFPAQIGQKKNPPSACPESPHVNNILVRMDKYLCCPTTGLRNRHLLIGHHFLMVEGMLKLWKGMKWSCDDRKELKKGGGERGPLRVPPFHMPTTFCLRVIRPCITKKKILSGAEPGDARSEATCHKNTDTFRGGS